MTSNDSGVDTSNDSNDGNFLLRYQPSQPNPMLVNSPISMNLFALPQPYDAGERSGILPSNSHSMKMYRAKTRFKCTYPNILAGSNERKLHLAASICNVELLTRILEGGTNPNCSDEHKRSPLHLASCRGYIDVVRTLLKYGANPNVVDSLGNTPLHLAVISASTNNYNLVVRILLQSGASVHILDRTGKNPLDLANGKLRLIHSRQHNLSPETCYILEQISTMIILKTHCTFQNQPNDQDANNQLTNTPLTSIQLTNSQLSGIQITDNQFTSNLLSNNPLTINQLTGLADYQIANSRLTGLHLDGLQLSSNQETNNQETNNQETNNQETNIPQNNSADNNVTSLEQKLKNLSTNDQMSTEDDGLLDSVQNLSINK